MLRVSSIRFLSSSSSSSISYSLFNRYLSNFYSTSTNNIMQSVTPEQVHSIISTTQPSLPFLNDKIQLIDVRNHDEIETHGRIKGALNIPYHIAEDQPTLFSTVLSDLDRSSKVIFQCASGRRSQKAAQIALSLGFKDVYNMEGGFTQWKKDNLPIQPFTNNHSPWVHTIMEGNTDTAQYIVTDLESREAYVIDSVLDYDPLDGVVYPETASALVDFIQQHDLRVTKVIDTHVHADHLSAAWFLKDRLETKPEFWIGKDVTKVQEVFAKRYNVKKEELHINGDSFDKLISEKDTWVLGKDIQCSVIATPGHTPACLSYRIGDAAFVGDTLFMPDVGTARCDFPGGSATDLYESIQKMYSSWPDDTRIFVGHDYPPENRKHTVMTLLAKQKQYNKMINDKVTMEEFIQARQARDKVLKAPRFIHPSLQTNLRGGILPSKEQSLYTDGHAGRYFKIPVRWRE
ncbi:beta-lactamase-like protein [Halteromyces radiatus]|uniref:beta-lactamase-like protein n=1 Tax=Halteromyces radiatus TaxID=101107 RepID=UPI00221FBF25|nr:beta-lactamase-like protein [Halteromyces radiatus]KAI8088867.1 beta-lactamase-like protein [Halteromyces radiatus]